MNWILLLGSPSLVVNCDSFRFSRRNRPAPWDPIHSPPCASSWSAQIFWPRRRSSNASVTIFAKGAHEIVDQALLHAVANRSSALPAGNPLPVGTHPQAARTVAEHVADGQCAEAGGQRSRRQRLAGHLKEPAVERRHE